MSDDALNEEVNKAVNSMSFARDVLHMCFSETGRRDIANAVDDIDSLINVIDLLKG